MSASLSKLTALEAAIEYLFKATAEEEKRDYDPEGFHEGPRHGHYFKPGEREVGGKEVEVVQAPEVEVKDSSYETVDFVYARENLAPFAEKHNKGTNNQDQLEAILDSDVESVTVWHGTTLGGAKKILEDGMIRGYGGFGAGVTLDPYRAYTYTRGQKSIYDLPDKDKYPVVMQFEIPKDMFQNFTPEVGGAGRDELLFNPWMAATHRSERFVPLPDEYRDSEGKLEYQSKDIPLILDMDSIKFITSEDVDIPAPEITKQAGAVAARQRGLVPQSGDWNRPYRWVKPEEAEVTESSSYEMPKYDMSWDALVETEFKGKELNFIPITDEMRTTGHISNLIEDTDNVVLPIDNSIYFGESEDDVKDKVLKEYTEGRYVSSYHPPRLTPKPEWATDENNPFPEIPSDVKEIHYDDIPEFYTKHKYGDALQQFSSLKGISRKISEIAGMHSEPFYEALDCVDGELNYEHAADVFSQELDEPVTEKQAKLALNRLRDMTQKSLEHRDLPEKFYVFRGGKIHRDDSPMPTSLNVGTAAKTYFSQKGGEPYVAMYEVSRDDVLLDMNSMKSEAQGEEELIILGRNLKNPRMIRLPNSKIKVEEFHKSQTDNLSKLLVLDTALNYLAKSFASDSSIRIGNLDIPVELATDPVAGLSGRDNLIPGTGMLFHLDGHPVITMKGMKFPLDLVWMAGGRVVDLTENALVPVLDQETLYIPEVHATDVLEINGGEVQRLGIKIGDFVEDGNSLLDNVMTKSDDNFSKLLALEAALEYLAKMKPGEVPEYGDAPPNTPAYKGKRGGSFYYPSEVGTFTSVDDAAEEDIPIGEEIERDVVTAQDAGGMIPWKSYAEMLPSISKEEVSKQLQDGKRQGWSGLRDTTPVTPGVVMHDDDGNITSVSTPDGHMISVKEIDPKEPDRGGKSGLVIARTADEEVQAQWIDSQGRKQATYSFEHAKAAKGKKAAQVAQLVEVLPKLEKVLKRDMKDPKPLGKMRLSTIREAAFTISLIHDTFRRVGGPEGSTLITMDGQDGRPKKTGKDGKPVRERVKTYGITTMLGKHVKVAGNKVTLDFLGKRGIRNVVTVSDSSLAKELVRRKKESGPNGTLLNISEAAVNSYLKGVSGRDITAKNFRTYHGTRLGLEALESVGKPPSIKNSTFEADMVKLISKVQKKGGKDLSKDEWRDAIELYVIDSHNKFKLNLIGEPVSKRLGNQPNVALKDYISETIFEQDWDPSFSAEMEKFVEIPRFSARKVASVQAKIKEQVAKARRKKQK